MFTGLVDAWRVIVANPIIGFSLFAAISVLVILLASGRHWLKSLVGLARVFVTIFTTPFVFIRDALAILRDSGGSEAAYARTRVFMLFRYSRIQYLLILLGALVILSGGITASVLAALPRAEVATQHAADSRSAEIQAEIDAVNAALADSAKPDHRANLQTARDEALAAYDARTRANAPVFQNPTFRGEIILQLINAGSVQEVARLRGSVDTYMATCPRTPVWRGFRPVDCQRFRAFTLDVAERKAEEFRLRAAYEDADAALRNADTAAQESAARIAALQQDLSQAQAAAEAEAPAAANSSWAAPRLMSAGTILLTTLLSVIAFVWIGALIVDVLDWLILMMRSMEKTQLERLEQDTPYRRQPAPRPPTPAPAPAAPPPVAAPPQVAPPPVAPPPRAPDPDDGVQ